MDIEISGLIFKQTCCACPEQYDVFDSCGRMVGYVRLRWGGLTCEYPDVGGEVIYVAYFGDGFMGTFENDEQRMYHLNEIANRILNKEEENK